MGLENKTIARFFREMGAPEEIALEIVRISCKVFEGSEKGITSSEIFQGLNERYIATIGRDALNLLLDRGYLNYKMGLYSLTSGGRSTFSHDSSS
jgi:hypothetical protein